MSTKIQTLLLSVVLLACSSVLQAQTDSIPFRAYLYNKEYNVFMRINFHQQDIVIPGEDLFGPLPGYLGKDRYTFCWPIVSAKINQNKATITLINDYGSEDLTATLTQKDDTTYVLKQEDGSALKMPNDGKWQKLPKTLTFIKKGMY